MMLFFHYAEKATVVRFPEETQVEVLYGTAITSKGLIHPDVRMFEKRSSTASSVHSTDSGYKTAIQSRRTSSICEFHLPSTHNQVAPASLLPSTIVELDAESLRSIDHQSQDKRKTSFLNISQSDSFDIVSHEFKNENVQVKQGFRLSTPLRPLIPAYKAIEPVEMSRIPYALSSYLRDDELALPPGYVSHYSNVNHKY